MKKKITRDIPLTFEMSKHESAQLKRLCEHDDMHKAEKLRELITNEYIRIFYEETKTARHG